MVIQYFKLSNFQSFYTPYAPCLLWRVSSLRQELPIFNTFCMVGPYVNTADPSSDYDSGSIPG